MRRNKVVYYLLIVIVIFRGQALYIKRAAGCKNANLTTCKEMLCRLNCYGIEFMESIHVDQS